MLHVLCIRNLFSLETVAFVTPPALLHPLPLPERSGIYGYMYVCVVSMPLHNTDFVP